MAIERLRGTKCYGIGPIDRATTEQAQNWRRDMGVFLHNLGVTFLDPTAKPKIIGLDAPSESQESIRERHKLKQQGDYDTISQIMRTIRRIDLRCCDVCDFAITHLDLDVYSVGTWEEVFWVNRLKKVNLVHIEQGKINTPDWLLGTISHKYIFDSWDEIKQYLMYIHTSDTIDSWDRWLLFDYASNSTA